MAIMTSNNDLRTDVYFGSPVYVIDKPEWLNSANKVCDRYIKEAYDREKPKMKEREKFLGKKDFAKVNFPPRYCPHYLPRSR